MAPKGIPSDEILLPSPYRYCRRFPYNIMASSSLQIFYIRTSCFALFFASKGRVNFGHLSSLSLSSPKLLSLPFILCMQPNRNRHQERLREGGKGASKQHSASLLWFLHDFDPSLPPFPCDTLWSHEIILLSPRRARDNLRLASPLRSHAWSHHTSPPSYFELADGSTLALVCKLCMFITNHNITWVVRHQSQSASWTQFRIVSTAPFVDSR